MDENPYQPPQYSEGALRWDDPGLILRAGFLEEQGFAKRAVAAYLNPVTALLGIFAVVVLPAVAVALYCLLAYGDPMHAGPSSGEEYTTGFTVAGCGGLVVFLLRRSRAARLLVRLMQHPVLGRPGLRTAEMSLQTLSVTTPGGCASWNCHDLALAGYLEGSLILELEPHLLLAIPKQAQIDDMSFQTFRRILEKRCGQRRQFPW